MIFFNIIITRKKNVLPDEKLAMARHNILTNCDFLIDIGANNGEWLAKVRKNGFTLDALCIEPIKKIYQSLISKDLKNTNFLNCAIGNKNGYTYINNASNNGLSSSILDLNKDHLSAAPDIHFVGKEKIQIMKLSKILENDQHNKLYIKIDTPGYEFEVLKSLNKNNFKKIYAFEIEVNLVYTYKNLTLIEEVITFLRKRNFSPFRIENGFGMPNFGQQLQVDMIFLNNQHSKKIYPIST